jgi:riboflavin-specific deaminase-like protein
MPEQPRAVAEPLAAEPPAAEPPAFDLPAADPWGEDVVWRLVGAAAEYAARLQAKGEPAVFGLGAEGDLRAYEVGHPEALLSWNAASGWTSALAADDPRNALLDLYLPLCSATPERPMTVGHLGQSLDGFIATQAGDSRFVTGEHNILHLHRMRALCDAVIVGAGTVVADDPQLTTRHVRGASPLRVVLDPTRRLSSSYQVFTDGAAPTWYVCEQSRVGPDETGFGDATVVGLGDGPSGVDLSELVRRLRARGCARIFVEGGGVTVSAFLEAGLLDRLQMAIAPFLIGDGRPAIRLPGPAALRDCPRPRYRVFRMGTDVLFDIDFSPHGGTAAESSPDGPPVTRVI